MSRLKFSRTLNMHLTRAKKLYKKQRKHSVILNLHSDWLNEHLRFVFVFFVVVVVYRLFV